MTEEPPGRNPWVVAGQLTAVAWEFLGSIVAGAVLGYLLDRHFGWSPWGLIACTLLGTTTGLYRMIVLLKRLERSNRNG